MKAPVFIVGSPRSGTTLLYHSLISAGGFAEYLIESQVFDLVFPGFGDLRSRENRRKVLDLWLASPLFTLTGLERAHIEAKLLDECRTGGDFLRIFMEEIARRQHVERWAEDTPEHVLHLRRIKREIPDARVIHVIRDGRDVALSLERQGWIHPFSWDAARSKLVAGLYWEWMVDKGRAEREALGPDYLEVRYEELVSRPREALARVGAFIQHDLDYDRIRRTPIGAVGAPNTSFGAETAAGTFDPVGRWQSHYGAQELADLEALIGPTLAELGYPVTAQQPSESARARWSGIRAAYRAHWEAKLWLKTRTPLGRLFMRVRPTDFVP